MLSNITITDLLKIVDKCNIIDIRSIEKYNSNHIKNARNIPMTLLLNNPSKYLDFGTKYYIYCQQGFSSLKTCTKLSRMGYNVVNILGGYESYILEN